MKLSICAYKVNFQTENVEQQPCWVIMLEVCNYVDVVLFDRLVFWIEEGIIRVIFVLTYTIAGAR